MADSWDVVVVDMVILLVILAAVWPERTTTVAQEAQPFRAVLRRLVSGFPNITKGMLKEYR
jgi:hypothetical protein